MKQNLEEKVPKFLLEMVITLTGFDIEIVDRFEHFIRLFEEVPTKRLMCLLFVPWALSPQDRDLLDEPGKFARYRRTKGRDVHRREVIWFNAVEINPRDAFDPLVGESETL
jgi:hypothetical protein